MAQLKKLSQAWRKPSSEEGAPGNRKGGEGSHWKRGKHSAQPRAKEEGMQRRVPVCVPAWGPGPPSGPGDFVPAHW